MKKTFSPLCTISSTALCSSDRTTGGAWTAGTCSVSDSGVSRWPEGSERWLWVRVAESDCGRYLELDGSPERRVRQNVHQRGEYSYPDLRSNRWGVETHCSASARQVKLLNIAAGHLETYEPRQGSKFEPNNILRWRCTFGSLNNLT